jgi:hypothetical protein
MMFCRCYIAFGSLSFEFRRRIPGMRVADLSKSLFVSNVYPAFIMLILLIISSICCFYAVPWLILFIFSTYSSSSSESLITWAFVELNYLKSTNSLGKYETPSRLSILAECACFSFFLQHILLIDAKHPSPLFIVAFYLTLIVIQVFPD